MIEQKTEKGNFEKFLTIWIGQLIANIGSGMTSFGLGVFTWQLTHSAIDVALVELVAVLPMILLAPVAGVLADRYDRRLLMILGDFISAFGLIIMLFLMFRGNIQVWQICLCVGFSSVFASLLDPAYKATITDLLTEEDYAKANGLISMASSSKFLISPIIGGLLLATVGITVIIMIDILTLVITILAIFFVRKSFTTEAKAKSKFNFWGDFKEGWQEITKTNGVLQLVILSSLFCFYMGFVQVLFKPMCLAFASEKLVGLIQTLCACGMLLSSILLGGGILKRNYVNALVKGVIFAGINMVVLGATTKIFVIIIFGFLFFAALPFCNAALDFLIRISIGNEKQGRAWGLITLISQMGYIIAYLLSGILADYFFIPALREDGGLAESVGRIIGTGETRGVGFLIMLAGIGMALTALLVVQSKSIRQLEKNACKT